MFRYQNYRKDDFEDRKILFKIINELSFNEKLKLLKMDGEFIEFMSDPQKELQIEAVSDLAYRGKTIFLIDKPCDEAIQLSLEMNPYNISGMHNVKEKYQFQVVKRCISYIEYIDKPTENVRKYVEEKATENVMSSALKQKRQNSDKNPLVKYLSTTAKIQEKERFKVVCV